MGADANGIYLTTNEFSFSGPGFCGSQVYGIGHNLLPRDLTPAPLPVGEGRQRVGEWHGDFLTPGGPTHDATPGVLRPALLEGGA